MNDHIHEAAISLHVAQIGDVERHDAGDRKPPVGSHETRAGATQNPPGAVDFRTLRVDANVIDDLVGCEIGATSEVCGTSTHLGIDQGVQTMLASLSPNNAERVMVIVSDGIACMDTGSGWSHSAAHALALAAADAAADAGISIFVITLEQPGGPTGECFGSNLPPGVSPGDRNAELVRGFGRAYATPDPDDLDDLTTSILQAMPVHLVQ